MDDFFSTAPPDLKTTRIPGLFSEKKGRKFGLESLDFSRAGTFPGFEEGQNVIGEELSNKFFNPSFGPDTASEQALLKSIMDLVKGDQATRGLGGSIESVAQAVAPNLIQLRQDDIQNLQQQDFLNQGSNSNAINNLLALMKSSFATPIVQEESQFNFIDYINLAAQVAAGGVSAARS